MRDAFADVLLRERAADDRLFVLDGDCSRSTRSARLGQRYPDSFLNAGIAEQNLVGMAAGLALAGLRPVVSSFASIVVGRAAEQILLSVALPGLPVTFAGHYAGMSGGLEGAPHHAITDLAFMRAIPGMRVWIPADDADVATVGPLALAGDGPSYLRLCRDPVLPVPGGDRVGSALRWWPAPAGQSVAEAVVVACGVAVGEAIAAARALAASGVPTSVVGVLRLKPFPTADVLRLVAGARLVVTVEEHSVVGGLGSAVAETVAAAGGPPVHRLGVADRFTETGPHRELLTRYGIDAGAITGHIRSVIHRGEDARCVSTI